MNRQSVVKDYVLNPDVEQGGSDGDNSPQVTPPDDTLEADDLLMKVVQQRAAEAKESCGLVEAEPATATATAPETTAAAKAPPSATKPALEEDLQNLNQVAASLPPSRPGAFACRASFSRQTTADAPLDDVEAEVDEESQQDTIEPSGSIVEEAEQQNSSAGLVEAIRVEHQEEPIVLGRAREIDPAGLEEGRRAVREKSSIRTRSVGCLLVVVFLVVLAVVIGVVVHHTNKSKTTEAGQGPHSMPSMPPSPAPSLLGETNIQLQIFRDELPDFSLTSLQDPNSPQSKAWIWLEGHQNVTSLPQWRMRQLFALATFYYAYNGPRWPMGFDKDWLDDTKSECLWYSGLYGYYTSVGGGSYNGKSDPERFACNEKGEFETIILSHGGMLGFSIDNPIMPLEMSFLTSLNYWSVGHSGTKNATIANVMPTFILQKLTNLEYLRLSHDDFSGMIPSQVGLLTKLTDFRIWGLSLSGTVPTEIGSLTQLKALGFDDNILTGPIPSQMGALTNLELIDFHGNTLTGRLPSQLALLTRLQVLDLMSNKLSGQLPSQIGLMTKLQALQLNENLLTGSIPVELVAANTSMPRSIRVTGNTQLSGTVPSDLCIWNQMPGCDFEVPLMVWDRPSAIACSMDFDCTGSLCGCDCPCS